MTDTQAATTRFCARVIGPLLLIIGAIVVARYAALVQMMPAILQDEPLSFAIGIFTLTIGLILFAAHHHWSGPTAIVVSLIGVLTIVRGVLLMLAPAAIAGIAERVVSLSGFAWIAGGVALLIGAWLTWAGWFAKSV
jgi:hypothetical protein